MRTRHAIVALLALPMAMGCGDEAGPTTFTLTFENVSAPGGLATSAGAVDVVFAAGVWALFEDGGALFTPRQPAPEPIRAIAEDGENVPLLVATEDRDDAVAVGTLAEVDVTTYDESPLWPGVSVGEEITATPGQALSFASMFVQSNDVFLAPAGGSLALFDADGSPVSGDVTAALAFYDAGTEVNQEPGVGSDQPPRQGEHGVGEDEAGVITRIDGMDAAGFSYPDVAGVFRLTVTPQ